MNLDPNSIRQKLEYLNLRDSKRRIFGSGKHQYELAPCLTREEIREFENQHEFQLPEEYREFLRSVGSSGAGPYYGINSLEVAGQQIAKWGENPASSFPYTKYHNGRAGLVDDINDTSDDEELQKYLDEYLNEMCPGGSIIICDFGNDLNFRMITAGNDRFPAGSIWFNKMADQGGLAPIALATGSEPSSDMTWCVTYRRDVEAPVSFTQWYQCWLDEAVRFAETL